MNSRLETVGVLALASLKKRRKCSFYESDVWGMSKSNLVRFLRKLPHSYSCLVVTALENGEGFALGKTQGLLGIQNDERRRLGIHPFAKGKAIYPRFIRREDIDPFPRLVDQKVKVVGELENDRLYVTITYAQSSLTIGPFSAREEKGLRIIGLLRGERSIDYFSDLNSQVQIKRIQDRSREKYPDKKDLEKNVLLPDKLRKQVANSFAPLNNGIRQVLERYFFIRRSSHQN